MAALVTLVLAAGPCAPIVRSAPDAPLAAVYAEVARAETDRTAAAVAWRRAAELLPEGSDAERALAALCAFDRARPLLDEGRCAEAAPLLEAARAGPDAAAADTLTRACAEGRDAALTAWLRLDARAPAAARPAANDRLSLELVAEAGYDSNATLAALTTANANDGFAAGTALLAFRPLGADGPFVVAGGGYRKQLFFPQSDVGLALATLGWEHRFGPVRASLDGGLDGVALGGALWLVRPRATAAARARLGAVQLAAEYGLRHEQLFATAARDDSGFRHLGELELAVALGAHLLGVAVGAHRTSAVTAERSSTEAGVELREYVRSPSGRWTFEAALGARWRGFDAMDAELQALRREAIVDARVLVDVALDPSLSLFAAVDGRHVFSSIPELTYARWNVSAGLRLRVDLW